MKIIVGDILDAPEKVLFFVENALCTKLSGNTSHLADQIVGKYGFGNPFSARSNIRGQYNLATNASRPMLGSAIVKYPPKERLETDPIIGALIGNK